MTDSTNNDDNYGPSSFEYIPSPTNDWAFYNQSNRCQINNSHKRRIIDCCPIRSKAVKHQKLPTFNLLALSVCHSFCWIAETIGEGILDPPSGYQPKSNWIYASLGSFNGILTFAILYFIYNPKEISLFIVEVISIINFSCSIYLITISEESLSVISKFSQSYNNGIDLSSILNNLRSYPPFGWISLEVLKWLGSFYSCLFSLLVFKTGLNLKFGYNSNSQNSVETNNVVFYESTEDELLDRNGNSKDSSISDQEMIKGAYKSIAVFLGCSSIGTSMTFAYIEGLHIPSGNYQLYGGGGGGVVLKCCKYIYGITIISTAHFIDRYRKKSDSSNKEIIVLVWNAILFLVSIVVIISIKLFQLQVDKTFQDLLDPNSSDFCIQIIPIELKNGNRSSLSKKCIENSKLCDGVIDIKNDFTQKFLLISSKYQSDDEKEIEGILFPDESFCPNIFNPTYSIIYGFVGFSLCISFLLCVIHLKNLIIKTKSSKSKVTNRELSNYGTVKN